MLQQITIPDDGALPAPVRLTRGDRNQLRFLVNAPELQPDAVVSCYAAITRLDQLLALELQNLTFARQPDGLLAIELSQIEINTIAIQKLTLDQRPTPGEPDVDGEFTFCRANLEIGCFDSPTAEETCFLLRLPVEIRRRNYLADEPAPTPREHFYTKAETDQKIADAVIAPVDCYTKTETDQKIADAVTGAAQNCHDQMQSVFGAYLTQYGEVLNGRFL